MLKVKIIAVGTLKERFWKEAVAEYQKRLTRYIDLEIAEIKEAKIKDKASHSEIVQALNKEAAQILKQINITDYAVSLAIDGQMFSSEQFSSMIDTWEQNGKRIIFIIGSSHGLARRIAQRADLQLSFSKMTFPHQMMRLCLLEQVYRGYKISRKEVYHK